MWYTYDIPDDDELQISTVYELHDTHSESPVSPVVAHTHQGTGGYKFFNNTVGHSQGISEYSTADLAPPSTVNIDWHNVLVALSKSSRACDIKVQTAYNPNDDHNTFKLQDTKRPKIKMYTKGIRELVRYAREPKNLAEFKTLVRKILLLE